MNDSICSIRAPVAHGILNRSGDMLTIRKQQMEAFRLASISRFENWLAKHIATLYPQQSELLGELGVRKFIRKAIETGSKYGVDTEGAVTTLIELMLAYGG